MRLTDLFGEFIPDQIIPNGASCVDPEVTSICTDVSRVKDGSLFAAISGFKFDGHLLCEEAVEMGATVLLTQHPVNVKNAVNVVVPNVRKALAFFAGEFYGRPSADIRTVGITGTNGKTTTSYMLAHILNSLGHGTSVLGTAGRVDSDGTSVDMGYTTPEPLLLHEHLRDVQSRGEEFAVLEVSSQALDQYRVYGIDFDGCVFTNLSRDHLDYHKNMTSYRDAKFRLLSMSEFRLVNYDCEAFSPAFSLPGVSGYSFERNAEFRGKDLRFSTGEAPGSSFNVAYGGKDYAIDVHLPGMFNAYNALAAFSAACLLGMDPEGSAAALGDFKGVVGRCEYVPTGKDFSVMIDFAHTPDGLLKILTALRPYVTGRLICLFGCGGDRDRSKRPVMGKVAAENSDLVIVTSDNPRSEPCIEIISDILKGIPEGSTADIIPDRKTAIMKGIELLGSGDLLLVAGKGHEKYQIVGNKYIEFNERKIISEALEYKE